MESKISLKWSLFIVSIAVAACLSIIIFSMTFDLPDQNSLSKSTLPIKKKLQKDPVGSSIVPFVQGATFIKQTNLTNGEIGKPIRLKIPKINIDAHIENVGLTSEGAMDVPQSPENVAWLASGPRPGEKGISVIAGHFGWRNGILAAFDNLSGLRAGDKLYVEDNNGLTATFVVLELKIVLKDDDTSIVFESSDEKARLNLITCEGAWDKTDKSYSNRLVVFAERI